MERRVRMIPAVIAGILVVLAGCSNVLESPGKAPVPGGKGRVAIRVEDGARTALPSGPFDKYTLRFAYTGTGGYIHSDVVWNSETSVDLEPGDWTVSVDAYVGETVSGTGSAAVVVNAGTVTPVTIRVGIINTGAGIPGTLKYTVNYPAGHTYGTETLTVRDALGAIVGNPVAITSGAEGSLPLAPGVYFVGVVITDTVQRTGVARTSAAHIYGGKETSLEIEIEEDEFTVLVPLVVTADLTVSDALTVDSRAVAAYRDPACTDILGTADTGALAGPATVTLWAPSADAVVYVRQEVELDGITLNGESVLVNIDDPEQFVEASLDDSFYKVTTSGLIDGTVTAAPIALSGSSIAVTVEPATNYILKSGTLKYNDEIGDHDIIDYAFAMPASDVTISAFFNRALGFTIEGPGDLMVPVTIVNSAGGASTEISWSDDESILFTVEGSNYTAGTGGNLRWIVNGAESVEITTASGNSHTIEARDYVLRSYTVTVMIEEDGQWYSREIPFKVTE